MKYCVIKNTITVIDGSDNSDEIMRENALSAGIAEFEILIEEEFKARVESLPPVPQPPTELKVLQDEVAIVEEVQGQVIDTLAVVLGVTIGE